MYGLKHFIKETGKTVVVRLFLILKPYVCVRFVSLLEIVSVSPSLVGVLLTISLTCHHFRP